MSTVWRQHQESLRKKDLEIFTMYRRQIKVQNSIAFLKEHQETGLGRWVLEAMMYVYTNHTAMFIEHKMWVVFGSKYIKKWVRAVMETSVLRAMKDILNQQKGIPCSRTMGPSIHQSDRIQAIQVAVDPGKTCIFKKDNKTNKQNAWNGKTKIKTQNDNSNPLPLETGMDTWKVVGNRVS